MSLLKKIIHSITSRLPASFHQRLSSFYNARGIVSLYHDFGVKSVIDEIFFRKYTGKKEYLKLRKKLDQVRRQDVITVAFQVWNVAKWKCDSVFHAMKKHPRFNPIIWIANEPGASRIELDLQYKKLVTRFTSPEYTVVTAEDCNHLVEKINPDLIFIQEPYSFSINSGSNAIGKLFCFVRYCFPNSLIKKAYNYFLIKYSLFYFLENWSVAREHTKMRISPERNMYVTGHPMVDAFFSKKSKQSVWKRQCTCKKKIIWAPHWTINQEAVFSPATFLRYAQFMLQLAQIYCDKIQMAFKPHPTLYRKLCEHPDWGKELTDEYYSQWASMSNTQLETGEYIDLFLQSNAMIHDCGSFILEYLLVDKPCMYLQNGADYPHYNEMNKEALKCYEIALSEIDIENFIVKIVFDNEDDKATRRRQFISKYLIPPNNKTAAENIIDAIINS